MGVNTNTMDQITRRRAPDQPSTKSIATSRIFTFMVGPDQTEFTIHAAIVAKLSPVLNVLVNGPSKEAMEQRVEWIDLEEAVFLSFWEFAYSGDYTDPIQEDDEQEETDPVDEELSNWGNMITVEDRLRMQKARESGEFTDFAFTCEGETIPVHRIIVCGQSTVFHRACTGKFKEALSGIYDLNDHPLQVVNRMVEYIYTGAYAIPDDAGLLTHATMFTLADKYGISGLQEFTGGKYLECLHQYYKFNNQDFTSSITEVYKVPREISKNLRNATLVLARLKLRKALATEELEAITEEFVYDCPQFAKELISLFLRLPLMGACANIYCKSEGLVPIEPL